MRLSFDQTKTILDPSEPVIDLVELPLQQINAFMQISKAMRLILLKRGHARLKRTLPLRLSDSVHFSAFAQDPVRSIRQMVNIAIPGFGRESGLTQR